MKIGASVLSIIITVTFVGCSIGMRILNEENANLLSADLANQECEKIYSERPFLPEHYKAVFSNGRWQWGYIDPAGIKGYSAEVSFRKDGSDKRVLVSFSTDIKLPNEKLKLRRKQNFFLKKR